MKTIFIYGEKTKYSDNANLAKLQTPLTQTEIAGLKSLKVKVPPKPKKEKFLLKTIQVHEDFNPSKVWMLEIEPLATSYFVKTN